jgi:hypothetical protein
VKRPGRNWSGADDVLDSWSAVTATSRPPGRLRPERGLPLAWLAPAVGMMVIVVVLGVLVVGRPGPFQATPVPAPTSGALITSSPQTPPTATKLATPVVTPTETPAGTPTPTATVTPTPIAEADPALLAAGSWTAVEDQIGSSTLYFGRLDGRAFTLSAPGYFSTGKPADNGSAISWRWDPDAQQSVVLLIDTATGSAIELYRTKGTVSSAAIAPDGAAWFWIEAGSPNALWRQTLPEGQPVKLAQLRPEESRVQLSADGSKVVITENSPNGNSDCPSARYRVWDVDTGQFKALPTNPEELIVGVIADEAFIEGWCSQIGLFEVNLNSGRRRQIASDDAVSPGVYTLDDGSSAVVYSGVGEMYPQEALFEYVPGERPRQLYDTGNSIPDLDNAQLLVSNSDLGGINIKGWAPFFPGGMPYSRGPDTPESAGTLRLLINLTDGSVAVAPPIGTPVEVPPPSEALEQ